MSGAGKTPLLFSEKGGKLLQKMATNFGKKQKQQQRHQAADVAAASASAAHQPDPVLWF